MDLPGDNEGIRSFDFSLTREGDNSPDKDCRNYLEKFKEELQEIGAKIKDIPPWLDDFFFNPNQFTFDFSDRRNPKNYHVIGLIEDRKFFFLLLRSLFKTGDNLAIDEMDEQAETDLIRREIGIFTEDIKDLTIEGEPSVSDIVFFPFTIGKISIEELSKIKTEIVDSFWDWANNLSEEEQQKVKEKWRQMVQEGKQPERSFEGICFFDFVNELVRQDIFDDVLQIKFPDYSLKDPSLIKDLNNDPDLIECAGKIAVEFFNTVVNLFKQELRGSSLIYNLNEMINTGMLPMIDLQWLNEVSWTPNKENIQSYEERVRPLHSLVREFLVRIWKFGTEDYKKLNFDENGYPVGNVSNEEGSLLKAIKEKLIPPRIVIRE